MRTIENHIEIAPTLQDIKEILVWLKEEKDRDVLGHGFFNNKNIIMDSFRLGKAIVFKHENKSIGLIVWNESDDILVNIDIFVIHPSYRGKGFGALFYHDVCNHFVEKGFKAVKLFCEPKTSEKFWIKMGLLKLHDCGYTEHELTYYGVLIDIASTIQINNAEKIELWDVEPYEAIETEPRWTWYIENDGGRLLYPILHPCNCNWNLRWSRNGDVLKESKIKYFTNKELELFKSKFLYIEKL